MHRDDGSPTDARSGADEALVTARPPHRSRLVATWELDTLRDVGAMRRSLSARIAPGQDDASAVVSDDVLDRVLVVASELAFNAIQHGGHPAVVPVLVHGDRLILDVADHDLSTAPVVAGRRPAGEGGFGLMIARRFADQVAWYVSPPAKHVWATFPAGP